MLSWVEHDKSFITSGPDQEVPGLNPFGGRIQLMTVWLFHHENMPI